MILNLEIKKKSGYLHRLWKDRAKAYQRIAGKFRERGEENIAKYHETRAKEAARRSVAYDPKAV